MIGRYTSLPAGRNLREVGKLVVLLIMSIILNSCNDLGEDSDSAKLDIATIENVKVLMIDSNHSRYAILDSTSNRDFLNELQILLNNSVAVNHEIPCTRKLILKLRIGGTLTVCFHKNVVDINGNFYEVSNDLEDFLREKIRIDRENPPLVPAGSLRVKRVGTCGTRIIHNPSGCSMAGKLGVDCIYTFIFLT